MKSKEKKAFRKYLLVLILAAIVGYPLGFILYGIKDGNLLDDGFSIITNYIPIFFAFIHVAICCAMLMKYKLCKKNYRYVKNNEEDEDAAYILDVMMDSMISFVSFAQIFIFLSAAIIMYIAIYTEYMSNYTSGFYVIAINIVFVFITQIEYLVILHGIINIQKEITPGKKGFIFDFDFAKKWNNSLDEGERAITFEAGYAGFMGTIITCVIMWLATYIGMMIFETGVFPVVVVSIIWFVGMLQYRLKLKKLKRK